MLLQRSKGINNLERFFFSITAEIYNIWQNSLLLDKVVSNVQTLLKEYLEPLTLIIPYCFASPYKNSPKLSRLIRTHQNSLG